IDAPVAGTIGAGEFVLPVVQPGARQVVGRITVLGQDLGYDFFTLTTTAQVQAAASTNVTLVLPPLGSIAGTVRSAALAPIADLIVSLETPNNYRQATTDGQGHYAFLSVPAGNYFVIAYNPVNNVRLRMPVTVTAEHETPADITFPQTSALIVRLVYP